MRKLAQHDPRFTIATGDKGAWLLRLDWNGSTRKESVTKVFTGTRLSDAMQQMLDLIATRTTC